MDSINLPVGSEPEDPYERYRVEALERDRIAKEEFAKKKQLSQQSSPFIVAYLKLVYEHLLALFETKTERGVSTSVEKTTRQNLALFKDCLNMLQEEDLSQDIEFLNRLSQIWYAVLEDSLRFRKTSPFALAFRTLLRELQHYPEGAEHSLGYYFSEYAGQTWLPFPYMELMMNIHRAHKANRDASPLTRWCAEIDQLIALLNPT